MALSVGTSRALWAWRGASLRLKNGVLDGVQAFKDRAAADERNLFFAAAVDLLAVVRADGICQHVNAAVENLLGWTPEEWTAKPLAEFLHPNDRSIFAGHLAHAISGQSVVNLEARCQRKDGTSCWIAWSAAAANSDGIVFASGRDVSARKREEKEFAEMHTHLLEASRQAGMAEIATGVLHNVGKVLNSVNVSASLLAENVRKSRITKIDRVADLLEMNAADLATLMTESAQGRTLPGYLRQLHGRLVQEQQEILAETTSLQMNIAHIKAMQQAYARVSGVAELMTVNELVEDSLRLNAAALHRHGVIVERDFCNLPVVSVEKHRVLQILVNLIGNAKNACDESGRTEKR